MALATEETPAPAVWLARAAGLCGGLSAALGLAVLVGWYTHTLALLQIAPAFVAMAYNTALGFFFGGLGLAALPHVQSRLARGVALLGAAYCVAVGALTLSEYLFGFKLGIDELMMRSYIRSGVTAPGRMAFCTALSFFLVGSALLLSRGAAFPGRQTLSALIGSIVVGLGIVALSGYCTGIIQSYIWGQFTRMAVHTATGFVVLGVGVIVLAYRDRSLSAGEASRQPPLSAILVGIGAASTTLSLWQALVVREKVQIDLIHHLAAQNTSAASLSRTQELLPLGELIGGLVLSALLARTAALAQTARHQADELRGSQDELERRVLERTEDLACANHALAEMAGWQRDFLRDVLASVTDGKLNICMAAQDLPAQLEGEWGQPISLTPLNGLRELRCTTLEAAAERGFTEARMQDLVTAVNEAGMNAIVHAGTGSARVYHSPDGVQIWVEDTGKGITMENLPRATLSRGFTTAGTLGHGLKMMLQTADRLWLLTGPTGTTVVLEQERLIAEPLWARLS